MAYNFHLPVLVILAVLANLAILVGFLHVSTYIHEFGHAVAARLVGVRVHRVTIGTGKEVWRRSLFGVPLVVTNNYWGGSTSVGSVGKNHVKLRFAFYTAGGILAESLVTVPCLVFLITKGWAYLSIGNIVVVNMFVAANATSIVSSLIPRHVTMNGVRVPNDGLGLVKAPVLKEHDISVLLIADRWFKATQLFEQKEDRAAAAAYEECIRECPFEPGLRLNLAVALRKLGNLEKAEAILMQLIQDARAMNCSGLINNALAWINLLYYTDESIQKAYSYSKVAFKFDAHCYYIMGTRGAVLIAVGKFEEGLKLLSRITNIEKKIDPKANSAVNLAFLGYAHLMTGKVAQGQEYLKHAESYYSQAENDEKRLLDVIRSEVSAIEAA